MAEKENLDGLTLEQLLERAETDTKGFQWGYRNLFSAALKNIDATQHPELAERLRSEGLLWDLQPDRKNNNRLGPMFTGENEKGEPVQYPDPENDFPAERLAYYEQQLTKTRNPRRIARYGDALWQFTRNANAARAAVKAHLECAQIFFDKEWDHELVDSLAEALRLALSLNDEELLQECVDNARMWIDKLREEKRPRWALEISESLIAAYSKTKHLFDFGELERFLTELAEAYEVTHQFLLEQGCLDALLQLKKTAGDREGLHAVHVRIADAYLREADFKKGNHPGRGLAAAHFYEKALVAYENAGACKEQIENTKVKLQEANRLAAAEMTPISTSIEIKKEEIDSFVKPYEGRHPQDILGLLCVDPRLVMSFKDAEKRAIENSKEFIVSHLMPTSVIQRGVIVRQIVEPEEKLKFETVKIFQLSYMLAANLGLRGIFDILDFRELSTRNVIEEHLARTGIVDEVRRHLVMTGVERYAAGDYVSAIHILVFQVEGLLRDMLGKLGLPIFKKKRKEYQAKTLWDCIEALRNGSGIDGELLNLIEIFLHEITADNLRNDVGHGLAEVGAFSRPNADLLLYILIRLAGYGIKKGGGPTPPVGAGE